MAKTSREKATWIWYPGDFEIWLGNRFNNRRTERGAVFPPFWKQDSPWATVTFCLRVDLARKESVRLRVDGRFSLSLDGKLQFGQPAEFTVPAGRHEIAVKVHNPNTPPALFAEGTTIRSGKDWTVTYEDKIWIDENGVAHGSGVYVPPGQWNFDDPDRSPASFRLPCEYHAPASVQRIEREEGTSLLLDFGRETFGYLQLEGVSRPGSIDVFYGESREEACDRDFCETLDRFELGKGDFTAPDSKAFRFVLVDLPAGMEIARAGMQFEYLPQNASSSGTFACSDEELNRIWEVSAYTLDLTTREFMTDGIKRDRWTWSGDAIQSYLMNYYLHFDVQTVKRTIRQLRGKDPVTSHINTILDYTFYWFKSICDYYLYTGDEAFVREIYPRMKTLADYVLGRLDADGLAVGQPDDWVFVDWVDFPMHKRGVLCFEQFLLAKSLETMQLCRDLVGDTGAPDYGAMAREVLRKTDERFWNPGAHAYMHALEPQDGRMELNPQITKFPNMFAVNYGFVSEERAEEILEHVLQNPEVPAITTPYLRFYELEALCSLGCKDGVIPQIKAYWGGMLREGATSFWEKYNPEMHGAEHLAMYGRPYGKSLCHAWGASPLYLIGRYFLGVEPTAPGYAAWTARPCLGGLEWMKGDVPTPHGLIHIEMDRSQLRISVPKGIGEGTVFLDGQQLRIRGGETATIGY